MNEYGIIKFETNYIDEITYNKILSILDHYELSICNSVSYKIVSDLNNGTEYKYLVNVVKGKNVQKILTLLKSIFNDNNLNFNKQIYVTRKDFFDFDLRKYFGISRYELNQENKEQIQPAVKPNLVR